MPRLPGRPALVDGNRCPCAHRLSKVGCTSAAAAIFHCGLPAARATTSTNRSRSLTPVTLSAASGKLVTVFAITGIEHRGRTAEQGQNLPVFVPPTGPLAELRAQYGGLTFGWLPDPPGARWDRIGVLIPSLPIPTLMPRLTFPEQSLDVAYGRPRTTITALDRLELTVALVDLAGQSRAAAARLMHGTFGDPTGSSELKKVRRDLKAGRSDLFRRHVLPWAMWSDGKLPSEWWSSPEFDEAIKWWREDAARKPAGPAAGTYRARAHPTDTREARSRTWVSPSRAAAR